MGKQDRAEVCLVYLQNGWWVQPEWLVHDHVQIWQAIGVCIVDVGSVTDDLIYLCNQSLLDLQVRGEEVHGVA